MNQQSSDPFEHAGDVLGYIIVALALVPLVYAMAGLVLPWLFR